MLTVDLKIKDWFFDRLKVIAQVDKDKLRFLRNAGGFARRTARNSMKRKGRARRRPKGGKALERWKQEVNRPAGSPPGSPPYVHTTDAVATLKNILFALNAASQSVVVGPVGLNQKQYLNGQITAGSVPALHEYGGDYGFREKELTFRNGGRKWVPIGKRLIQPGQRTRVRKAKYPARPYMAPAMQKTQSKFKDLWFTNANAMRDAG